MKAKRPRTVAREAGKTSRFRASEPTGTRRYTLERLEERILFSADAAFLGAALAPATEAERHAPSLSSDPFVPERILASTDGQVVERSVDRERVELVIVDPGVADAQELVERLRAEAAPGTHVYLLDAGEDGLAQIGEIIAGHDGIDAVHLLSHGNDAVLRLGTASIDDAALLENAEGLAAWNDHLDTQADILIYGCDLAAGTDGERFVQILADLTGADVAASDDATGHRSLGGDWQLEHAHGEIETAVIASEGVQQDWMGLLGRVVHVANEFNNDDVEIKAGEPAGQEFVHTSGSGTYTVGEIDLLLFRESGAPAQTLTVTIRDGWNGNVLGTATFDPGPIGSTFDWHTLTLDSQVQLVDGVAYVLKVETSSGGEKIRLGGDKNDGYAGGDRITKDGSIDAGKDVNFRLAFEDPDLTEVTLGANQDAFIDEGQPNTNHGSDTTLLIDREDNDLKYVLAGFDISSLPAGAVIESARVEFEVTNVGGDISIEAREIRQSWSEGAVTWNERASGVAWSSPFGTTAYDSLTLTNGDSGAFGLDITALVRDWQTGTSPANGVMIGSFDTGGDREIDILSRESGSGPTLRILYSVPNTDPTVTSPATFAIDENTTTVGSVTATDAEGDTLVYSIDGGADSALFSIDATSGALSIASRNFESPTDAGGDNVYDVTVGVSDGNGGSATQAIAVTVTNVNEDPVITSAAATNAAENQTTVLTVTSTDVDGGTPTYAISGGADAALFSIDGSSGALTFTNAPDFESPGDAGTDNVYDVVVQAADGNGGTATQAIAITVTNVNEDPVITSAAATNAAENQTAVLTVTSTDVDGGIPTYAISGGADAALFSIDGSSGALTFTNAPDFESPTDAGGDNVYDVVVQAADGNGGAATQAIAVTVTNANEDPVITSAATTTATENQTTVLTVTSTDVDGGTPTYAISGGADAALFSIDGSSGALTFTNAPDFESPTDAGGDNVYDVVVQAADGNGGAATQAIAVTVTNANEDPVITSAASTNAAENQTTVLTVISTDVDGGTPTYSISGGADAALFSIDGSSGALTFTNAPDFESPGDAGGDNVYDVTVGVSDGNGGSATQAITVTVTNVNEDPVITSAASASVSENQTTVLTVTSTDVDGGTPTYSISGGADAALFSIDGSSGALTFTNAPDFESPGDVGTDNVYDVTVGVSDGNGGSATQAITVTVTNSNEDPVITSAASASVSENQTSVLTVTSTDVDGGTPTYSISGGADAALFSIDGSSGALTFTNAPDFEAPSDAGTDNVYDVVVQAADGNGGTATQAIAVTVTNVNEDPVITSAATTNAAENQTTVLTVTSTDVDGGTPTYSISGGADAALFSIDGSSGALTFTNAPDFEAPGDAGGDNVYDVTVGVSDGNGGSATQAIAVTVTNVNEDPIITSATSASVSENQTTVLTVTSTDVDGGTPTYAISGGVDAALFSIDGSSGALTFTNAPDFEAPGDAGTDNVYDVTVGVSDGNGGSATQAITVTVTNSNEDPVITSAATTNAAENQTTVLTVTSTDVDGGTPTYSISGGADAALFSIDGSSGALTFTNAPDFEAPSDAGTDNVYDVVVQAADGNGGSASQAIAVTVTNVNEDPVITSAASASVSENQTSVLTVTSTDVDGGTPTYAISGGADAALFSIDGSSGALSFTNAPDFESPGDAGTDNVYDVVVQAADGNGGTATQAIAVTVTNVNEDPVITSAASTNAAENQTTVLTVISTDVDGGTPTYAISGGADAALFSIDGSSGALTFTNAPNFEAPGDAGGDNVYDVTVGVSDGNGGSATQAITVTVTNSNEDPVITSAATTNAAENQTTVLTVTSTDVDGGTPTYSISGGADAALFSIDGSSGALTFTNAPDFESPGDAGTDNVYDVVVQAADGNGGSASQAIAVTVTNVNEDPVITSAASASLSENQTSVLTVTSTDVDGGTPTYSISGGADAALFSIDGSSGALTFTNAPDFEAPSDAGTDNVYDVVVQAADGNGGTATQAIAITVTNVNEDPVITSAASASVSENQTSVLTVTSTDVDGGTPTYAISGGADAALFSIDGSSGALTFTNAPDFESPGDAGGDNVYDVTVGVSDGNGGSATQAITVTVTNVNEDPVITSAASASVSENQTTVLTVTSTDVDGGTPTYSISGGADAALFSIDGSSGALTFTNAPDFESPGDAGTDNVYDVTVGVSDGNGGSATQAIAVTVTNVNEDPVITSAASTNAAENQTTVLTVISTDVDGGTPTYAISGGADAALFSIDGSSGALTFTNAPNFEAPGDAGGDNVYDVTVGVSDGNGGSATQAITVTVANSNEDPVITSAATTNAAENQTTVLTVTSTDVDGGTPTYSISGGADAALFSIDGSSGALTFTNAPDFESPGDAGTDNVYDVVVQAADGNGGSASQAIAVTVTNVNEDPIITSAASASVSENQTTVLTVTSTDVDGGTPTYSISGGADAALFSIDGSSGALTFTNAPDFEAPGDAGGDNVYDVVVQAADGNGGTATQAIAITVTNVNEDPVITSAASASVSENQTSVLTVTSTDVDGGTPTYAISGGADAALFSIDGSSGALTFTNAPDFESPGDAGGDNVYDVTVGVSDGNGGSATQAITVTVTNVNEDPVITSAASASVSENQTTVLTVTSTDVDGGTPTYSISGGADAALFSIDGSSGALTFTNAPDFESPGDAGTDNVYDVTVGVSDGNGGSATQAIAVTVTNVNEDPVITSAASTNAAESQTTVLTVTSTDVDGGTPTYAISGGADAALFSIDGSSGALTFTNAPDFESPGDAGTDNVYDVVVQAADGNGGTATQAIAITVTNVNEDPVITSAAATNAAENQTAVLTVTSTDVDGGIPTYAISGGADAALFSIDGSSGALTFTNAPDFESPGDVGTDNVYDVTVGVSDGNGGSATQAITVTVTNSNEDPVITSAASASVSENQTSVLTVTSTDVDGGTPTYSISGGADAALFSIDGSSGALTFTNAPDFEAPSDAGTDNVYDVVVQAADGNGGTATQAIVVTVTNVNEDPVITSAATTNAAENQTTVLTVTSTDVDGGTPTYAISGGADAALFSIDGSSGALTFTNAPDFESPGDAGTDNGYDVVVQAADGNGGTASQAIAVTVTNANEDPIITSAASASVSENQTTFLTVTSTDVDGGTPTYAISGGADAALFSIDGSSGALTFTNAPDFESPSDAGTDNVYDVVVQAADGNGGTASQAIAVTVTNVNEDPVITSAASASLSENQTSVLTVTSTDVDGGTPTYSISGGADAALFSIDGSSGSLTFTNAPDFEAPSDAGTDNVYDVVVQAADGNGGTATQAIAVTVTNVNEDPVITSAATTNAAENQTTVLTVTSTDVDGGTPTYSISGGADAALFSIDGSSGALTFTNAPDFESPGDAGTDNGYDVVVQAADGNGGTASQAIAVTVTNANEDPIITSAASASVSENQTTFLTVTSTDVDGGTPTYAISGGADAALFSIDGSSGALTFTNAPDFESPSDAGTDNVYDVVVQAADGNGGTASQAIAVTVTNVNEDPMITSAAATNAAENQTTVLTVTSTDVDGGTPTYAISGGAHAALFSIDGSSGALTFTNAPDFESPSDAGTDNVYDVTVGVSDGNGGSATQAIAVTVTNANEDPVITSAAATNAAENQTAVLTVTSTDVDGGTPTYSISGGADAALFSIDGSSGALTFTNAPDFESPGDAGTDNVYDVVVQAADGNGGTATQAIAITVTNANEDPIITSATSASVSENQTTVLTVTSTDVDGGKPTYAISGGADAALFSIDGSSGALTFTNAPDFESPSDAGTDNVYDVTVGVSDGNGGTATRVVSVTIGDVSEFAVSTIVDADGASDVIDEDASVGTIVGVRASAIDGDANDTVSYALTGDAGGRFAIDASTGAVTLIGPLDHEMASSHTITVEARSSDGTSTTRTIEIAVADVNESPALVTAELDVIASIGRSVGTVVASDPDLGDNVRFEVVDAQGSSFAIDARSGELTMREVVPAGVYELSIAITDSTGLTVIGTLQIRVADDPAGTPVGSEPDEPVLGAAIPEAIPVQAPPAGPDYPPLPIASVPTPSVAEIVVSRANPLLQLGDGSDWKSESPGLDQGNISEPGVPVAEGDERVDRFEGLSLGPLTEQGGRELRAVQTGEDVRADLDRAAVQFLIDRLTTSATSLTVAIDELFGELLLDTSLSPQLMDALTRMKSELALLENDSLASDELNKTIGLAAGSALTAGFGMWLFKSGLLAAAATSAASTWRAFDPIPFADNAAAVGSSDKRRR